MSTLDAAQLADATPGVLLGEATAFPARMATIGADCVQQVTA